jgi:4-diphosphocytidyl-2-C-methyl-D-erythritol kinase
VTLRLLAPAKINLGLAIPGKRDDGYHEIVTPMHAVGLYDTLVATPAAVPALTVDAPDLAGESNLVWRALQTWADATGHPARLAIALAKRIPAAAGLGGASSDAAATLALARAADSAAAAGIDLPALAATLGSDVPFFLDGPAAIATGRGERLQPVAAKRDLWCVLVTPAIDIPRKTATLYGLLTPADFRPAATAADAIASIGGQGLPAADALANAFERPLLAAYPDLAAVPAALRASGATVVALSGAGPTWYALTDDPASARAIADGAVARVRNATVHVAPLLVTMPIITDDPAYE